MCITECRRLLWISLPSLFGVGVVRSCAGSKRTVFLGAYPLHFPTAGQDLSLKGTSSQCTAHWRDDKSAAALKQPSIHPNQTLVQSIGALDAVDWELNSSFIILTSFQRWEWIPVMLCSQHRWINMSSVLLVCNMGMRTMNSAAGDGVWGAVKC